MVQKLLLVVGLMFLAGSMHAQFRFYKNGLECYEAEKYDEAISLFSEYLTKTTRNDALIVEAYYYRALSHHKKGSYKNAVADFDEALRRNHTNKGNIYWFKAQCHNSLNEHLEAIREYTHALRELDNNKDTKVKLLLERGKLYLKTGQADLAREDVDNGLALNPDYADLIELAAAIPRVAAVSPPDQKNDTLAAPWVAGETKSVADTSAKSGSVSKPQVGLNEPTLKTGTHNEDVTEAIASEDKPKDFVKDTPVMDTSIAVANNQIPPPQSIEEVLARFIGSKPNPWFIWSLCVVGAFFLVWKAIPESIKEKWLSRESRSKKETEIVYELLQQVRRQRSLLRKKQSGAEFVSKDNVVALNDSLTCLTNLLADVLIKLSLKSEAKESLKRIQNLMEELIDYITETKICSNGIDTAVKNDLFLEKWMDFNVDLAKEIRRLSGKYPGDFDDFIYKLENG